MYVYTCTCIIQVKRRDNFHGASDSIDCKLCNDLQYVDIVFIRLCFCQVNRVHNTVQFYVSISIVLVLVYVFITFYVTHLAVL